MEAETFLWLVPHAVVDGLAGSIHPLDAPADLSDQAELAVLRRHLPLGAASYVSPSQRIALDLAPEAGLRFAIDPLTLTRIDRLAGSWRVMSVNQRVA